MRAALLARRRALPAKTLAEAAASVLAELASLVRGHAPASVAGYVPIGAEPGGPGLPDSLAGALGPGGRLLLPVLLPDLDLDWADYAGHASLTPGARGLREPSGRRHGVDAVAVDRRGVRLGRGGGSYDRALARATGLTVALLHDGEFVDEVPAEAHDQRVRAVITPGDGLVMFTA
jgi:5-formyltetrahydrofolate cyclo-ligase